MYSSIGETSLKREGTMDTDGFTTVNTDEHGDADPRSKEGRSVWLSRLHRCFGRRTRRILYCGLFGGLALGLTVVLAGVLNTVLSEESDPPT